MYRISQQTDERRRKGYISDGNQVRQLQEQLHQKDNDVATMMAE